MIGHQVGHYTIVEELGAGAMGVVYRAEDPRLHREVAVKFLASGLDAASAESLLREARAAAALTHPNICAVYDVGEHDGRPFMVMELVTGPSLRELLDGGGVKLDQALAFAAQIGSGLAAAHGQGIVHGDIKPDNLMVAADGQLRIMDFGVAKALDESGAFGADQVVGTLSYLAPECLTGGPTGIGSDQWAFAATVYELVAGRAAFHGDFRTEVEYQITSVDPPPLTEVNRNCPPAVADSLVRALAKHPSDRPESVTAILESWEEGDVPGALDSSVAGRDPLSRRLIAITGALVLILGGVLVWQLAFRSSSVETRDNGAVTMAVADIRTISAEGGDNRGEGLTELLNIGLLESAPVRMTSREYLYDLRRRMFGDREGPLGPDEALAVSRRAGIAFLLAGQLVTDGKGDLATWRLIDVETGANIAANQVRGESWTELADGVIRGAVTALNGHLGSDDPIIPVTVADLTTTYPEAYELFVTGQVHLRNLQYEMARQSLTSAVEVDTTFALAHFALSRIYSNVHGGIGDGRLTAQHAESAWRHRTRLGRKDRLRVKAWRAQLGYRMTEARETFAEMLDQWPDDRELMMDQLEFLHHNWYFREGLAVATKTVEFYEDDPEVLDYQQDLLAAMGESGKALEVARRLTTLVPGEVSYWQELGSRWLELADPDQAALAAGKSLELDPGYLLGRIQLAQSLYARGDLAGAIAGMETILADTSLGAGQRIMVLTSSSFRPSLTMLYGDAGRMGDALAAFGEAEALTGSPGTLRAIQGRRHRFMLRHGYHEEALAWVRDILADDPGPSAWFNAAINGVVAYSQADSLSAATALVDSLFGREATIGGLARFMARRGEIALHLATGQADSVLGVIEEVRRDGLMPGGAFDIEIRLAEARGLELAGRLPEAEETLRDLLLIYAGCAPARLQLAQLLDFMDKPGEALAACEDFLTAWSDADPGLAPLVEAHRLKDSLTTPQ